MVRACSRRKAGGVETGAVEMKLAKKKCVPCEGGTVALNSDQVGQLLSQVKGWRLEAGAVDLRKRYKFPKFTEVITFVNRMAELAEAEGHHPDFCVHYTALDVSLSTHAIGGLSENDFILAAKIDELWANSRPG
jgi:4a-hydroxytetrahydrobiopterin dehydratase